MIGELYGDYYKFLENRNNVGKRDWIKIILSDILGGIGMASFLHQSS